MQADALAQDQRRQQGDEQRRGHVHHRRLGQRHAAERDVIGGKRKEREHPAGKHQPRPPLAILGSIGVVAQMPNFNRLLKRHDIDFELITAGEYKRTLTMLGENTDKGREKFVEEIEDVHLLFKEFVAQHCPELDIEKVATGEHWFGQRALDRGLVDELITSDEYIANACEAADVFEVKYVEKKTLPERMGIAVQDSVDALLMRWWERGTFYRFL
jgi:serine protease SohB